MKDGTVLEPFTLALKSCYRPYLTPGDSVLILGAGAISLCILYKIRGIEKITVSELTDIRREMAARIGAKAVKPAQEDLQEIILLTTNGRGVDVALLSRRRAMRTNPSKCFSFHKAFPISLCDAHMPCPKRRRMGVNL